MWQFIQIYKIILKQHRIELPLTNMTFLSTFFPAMMHRHRASIELTVSLLMLTVTSTNRKMNTESDGHICIWKTTLWRVFSAMSPCHRIYNELTESPFMLSVIATWLKMLIGGLKQHRIEWSYVNINEHPFNMLCSYTELF